MPTHQRTGTPTGNADLDADPRDTITPESFAIAPELLGLPLAGPWRRLGGMLVDLALAGLLSRAGGFLLALGVALALWRAMGGKQGLLRSWTRWWLRSAAVVIVFITAVALVRRVPRLFHDDHGAPSNADHVAGGGAIALLSRTGPDFLRLRNAATAEEAQRAAESLVSGLEESGALQAGDGEDLADELAGTPDSLPALGLDPMKARALRRALAEHAGVRVAERSRQDSLALAAVAAGDDSARAAELTRELRASLRSDSVAKLQRRLDAAETRARTLQAAVEQRGFLDTLRDWADELGLGFGWLGLYFTAFLALWNGQTPGKRIFGMRVLRLDGRSIGWWAAFERFGGYAAGLVTGLLGFAQVFWDRNRQAIHDKISETVVVRV